MKTKVRNLLCYVTSMIMLISLLPALSVSAAVPATNVVTYTYDGTPSAYEYYGAAKDGYGMSATWSASSSLSSYAGNTLEYAATDGTDKVLKITGEEYLATIYRPDGTKPYYGNLLQQVDFKFSQISEGAVVKFFGWANTDHGSEEHANEAKDDSGIMLYGDMLYVKEDFSNTATAGFNTGSNFVETINLYSSPILNNGLTANTWYTLSRIVDFSQKENQKQKITVKNRATGEIVGQTDWIQAGNVDQDSTLIVYTLPIRTRWFSTGDAIMIDNFKLANLSQPGGLTYEMVVEEEEAPSETVFTPDDSESKIENKFNDLTELKDGRWFSSAVKGLSAQYWPYQANNINAWLDNDTNLTDWNTKLTSDSTFQITGDTYISHQFTRPFDGVEQTKVDVKFSFGSRSDSEGAPILELFGYNTENYGGSASHRGGTTFADSGLLLLNGGLYTVAPKADSNGVQELATVLNDTAPGYSGLKAVFGNAPILPEGTLQNGTWYTIERLVDMNNALSTSDSVCKIHKQKIRITERESGNVVFVSEWIPAGHCSLTTAQTLNSSLVVFTYGLKTGETVELDNYSLMKGSVPSGNETAIDDYLADGASDTNKPGDIRFSADDTIMIPTKDNIELKKGNDVVGNEYYTVTPDEDGKSFVVSFDYLEPNTAYTLTVTGIEDSDYGLNYPDQTYSFTTGEAAAFVPLEITNKSFVNEDGAEVKSFTAGQKVRAAVEIENDGGDTSNMLIIMAVFDSEGESMKAAYVCEQTQFETGTYYTPYYTPEGGETAKILIWDNWTNVKSLYPAFSLGE